MEKEHAIYNAYREKQKRKVIATEERVDLFGIMKERVLLYPEAASSSPLPCPAKLRNQQNKAPPFHFHFSIYDNDNNNNIIILIIN